MAEEVTPPGPAHVDKTEQAKRLAQVERWMAECRRPAWIYAEALKQWGLGDRMVRKLITRVHARHAAEAAAQRPYEREDLAATMELVISVALEKGDLETARKATRDLMQFAGYLTNDGPPPSPPLAAGAPTLNIGQLVVDLRALTPIERRERLADLYRKREALGLPVSAPAPQKPLDEIPQDGAGDEHADADGEADDTDD